MKQVWSVCAGVALAAAACTTSGPIASPWSTYIATHQAKNCDPDTGCQGP